MRKARSRRSTARNPGLPLKKGRAGTMTHDYVRHGTTTLFAALTSPTARSLDNARIVIAIRSG